MLSFNLFREFQLTQSTIYQRPALFLAAGILLLLLGVPSISESTVIFRFLLTISLLPLLLTFLRPTSYSYKNLTSYHLASIPLALVALIFFTSRHNPSDSLEMGNYYPKPIRVHAISPGCFNGRYSFFLEGTLDQERTLIQSSLRSSDLDQLIQKRNMAADQPAKFYVKKEPVGSHKAYKLRLVPGQEFTNSKPYLYAQYLHAKMRMEHLKFWRKHLGSSMGSQFLLALMHGHHHSSDLSYTARRFGFSHLLAVSGMHIYVLGALFLLIVRLPFRLGFQSIKPLHNLLVQESLALILLFLYSSWISFNHPMPSVTRALLMRLIWLIYQIVGRRYDGIAAWALALTLHAIFLPKQVLTISSALSYGATFALLQLLPLIAPSFSPVHALHRLRASSCQKVALGLCSWIQEATLAQSAITFFLFPLILTFAPLPLLAFPVNCLLTPVTLVLLPLLFPLFMLSPFLPSLLIPPCRVCVQFFDLLLYRLADLPRTVDVTIDYRLHPLLAGIYVSLFFIYLVTRPNLLQKTALHKLAKTLHERPF